MRPNTPIKIQIKNPTHCRYVQHILAVNGNCTWFGLHSNLFIKPEMNFIFVDGLGRMTWNHVDNDYAEHYTKVHIDSMYCTTAEEVKHNNGIGFDLSHWLAHILPLDKQLKFEFLKTQPDEGDLEPRIGRLVNIGQHTYLIHKLNLTNDFLTFKCLITGREFMMNGKLFEYSIKKGHFQYVEDTTNQDSYLLA